MCSIIIKGCDQELGKKVFKNYASVMNKERKRSRILKVLWIRKGSVQELGKWVIINKETKCSRAMKGSVQESRIKVFKN